MSKRSISRKISINHHFPLPESSSVTNNLPNSNSRGSEKYNNYQDAYFGEQITDSNISSSTNSSDHFSSSDDICDIVSYSGSSTSGEDDIEIEATKRIQSEFDKLNNILYGEQDSNTPSNDDNEYNQWIEKFPHLRIVGSAVKLYECPDEHSNYVEPEADFEEEILAEHSECSCCVSSTNNSIQLNKSKIKEAVINSVLKEINSKMLKSRSDFKMSIPKSVSKRKERRDTRPTYDPEDAEVNEIIPTSQNFLQISASTLSMHTPSFKQPNFEYQSPILKSQLSASKWQREDSVDCASLPYISSNSNTNNSNNTNSNNVPYSNTNTGRKSSNGPFSAANKSARDMYSHRNEASSSRNRSMTTMKFYNNHSSKTRNLILPPIQNLNIDAERAKAMSSTPKKYLSTSKLKYSDFLAKQ